MLSVGMRVCVRVWKRTREPLCVRKRRRERAAQPARDAAWGRDQSCVRDPAGKCASRGCGQASAYVCPCAAECTALRAPRAGVSRHAAGQGGAAGRLSSREPRNRCISEAAKSQSWARRRLPCALTAPAHGRRPQRGSAVASCPHPCALGEVPDQATPPRRAQASPPPVQCSQRPPGTSSPSRSRRESCGWEGAAFPGSGLPGEEKQLFPPWAGVHRSLTSQKRGST